MAVNNFKRGQCFACHGCQLVFNKVKGIIRTTKCPLCSKIKECRECSGQFSGWGYFCDKCMKNKEKVNEKS